MFVAMRSNGSILHLLNKNWTREELERDRSIFEYECFICKEKVILKLGTQQSWHFSHMPDSQCTEKRETEDHKKGKLLVANWLQKHGFHPKVEWYIPKMKQRPDVYVEIKKVKYVIEIQRAFLSEEVHRRRDHNYLEQGFVPIWIGLKNKFSHPIMRKTNVLDALLMRPSPQWHAIYLDIKDSVWTIYTNFKYVTRQKTIIFPLHSDFNISPVQLFSLKGLTPTISYTHFLKTFYTHWQYEIKLRRQKCYLSMTRTEKAMLRIFQQYQLNLNYFPALGCLPLQSNFYFNTAPMWWQSWIIIECINKNILNGKIEASKIMNQLYYLIEIGIFHLRPLGKHPKELLFEAITEFFDMLTYFNVLKKQYNNVYFVIHHININKQLDTLCMDDLYIQSKIEGGLCSNVVE
ncbi:competence protein CoiA [Evansella cellulosilytica]|uniref:Competence CoiA family protein n=1 Tax=Evansella cellulosilytica (strain ATCC 21833 / DSM 2522 / FERM P-1141 / JCM 9156 / N-4) TaxID=649639 RepID=E6TX63_EVAC2|nr:competence protein CoiA family protein [Evansella cellulosilytica]ADU31152.1 Competence CoiA family protein [Evansella cellulosilytica DSM 2522]